MILMECNIRLETLHKTKELYIKDFKEIISMLISRKDLTSNDIIEVLCITDKIIMNIGKLEEEIKEEEKKKSKTNIY